MSGPGPKKPRAPSSPDIEIPAIQASVPASMTTAVTVAERLLPGAATAPFLEARSDYAIGAKLCYLGIAHPEHPAQDLVGVLAERRRRKLVLDRRPGKPHRAAHQRHLARGRVRQLDSQSAGDRLRLPENLVERVDRAVRHARRLERLDPAPRRALRDDLGEHPRQR